MLLMPRSLRQKLEAHAREGYPSEVCGFLLGVEREVREVQRATNLRAGSTRDRYEVDPRETLQADRYARENNLDILGFYHSHPNHPAVPSAHDAERAWPVYSYLILATAADRVEDMRSWRLDGGRMVEEPLQVTREGRRGDGDG